MKILLSKGSIASVALLTVLTLNSCMTVLVNAAATKEPNVSIIGSGYIELTWKSGKSETYSTNASVNLGGLYNVTIIPTRGWHISDFLIDGIPQADYDEDGLSLIDGLPKRAVSVTFEQNGGVDDVGVGPGAAYPTSEVFLFFTNVLTGGYAYAYIHELQQPGQIGGSWDVYSTADTEGAVTVCLVLSLPTGVPDPELLRIWVTKVVPGDVNFDGIVTADDVSMIANANPEDPADPALDLNNDNVVDYEDVTIASHHLGEESVWDPLDGWVIVDEDNGLVYVYGVTYDITDPIMSCK